MKAGDLAFPTGLVVVPSHPGKANSEQMLLVSNSSRHRIDAFDLASGKACGYVGGPYRGESLDRLNYPEGLAYDHASQQVYVADSNNGRVVVYRLRRTASPSCARVWPAACATVSNIVHEEQLSPRTSTHCAVHTLTGTTARDWCGAAQRAGHHDRPSLLGGHGNQLLVFNGGATATKLKVPHGENMYGITTFASEGGEGAAARVRVRRRAARYPCCAAGRAAA